MDYNRMYEPYGFIEGEAYYSLRNAIDDEIRTNREIDEEQAEESFAKVEFNSDTNAIVFRNSRNEAIGALDVTDMFPSYLIEEVTYDKDTQILTIKFDSAHVVEVDLKDIITVDEAGDGLELDGEKFAIKIADDSEEFLQVSSEGLKNVGIQDAIDAERDRAISAEAQEVNDRIADVDAEEQRAIGIERDLQTQITTEVSNRTQDVNDEEARAIAEETRLNNTIGTGFSTASTETVTFKLNDVNTKLTDEVSNRQTAIADEKRDRENADILLETKIENEKNRAIGIETGLRNDLTSEISRATSEEARIEGKVDGEITRATQKEAEIEASISDEVARATSEEERLNNLITAETENRQSEDAELSNSILAEKNRAEQAESGLQQSIDRNFSLIESLGETKADKSDVYTKQETESAIAAAIDEVVSGAPEAFDTLKEIADYIEEDKSGAKAMMDAISANTEDINALSGDLSTHISNAEIHVTSEDKNTWNNKIDASALDGYATEQWVNEQGFLTEHQSLSGYATEQWVEDKHYLTEHQSLDGYATEQWVNEQGFLTEHQDISNLATKAEVEAEVARATAEEAKKVDKEIVTNGNKALIFNESDGGGAKFEHSDGTWSFAGVNDGGENGIAGQIYALKKNEENKMEGTRIDVTKGAMYYTVGADAAADRMVPENEIAVKGDFNGYYSQEEVDTLIRAKETEIYNLTKLVGEIGGNVTYTYPNELGTSLTSLLGNYGTVKLGEDATITRYGPGVTAKNKVTLNLNNHNLTSTAASSYGAIMARGTQEITIGGKGTIDAGSGICIEANGTSALSPIATINLTGSTTTYRNNNPGAELIYCYVGTINITNGTFRNDGGSNYTLNCYDANYQNGTAKIIVTGGKFYDFNPADNSAEGEHTSFVPEGYHVETSTVTEDGVEHTIYTVKKD